MNGLSLGLFLKFQFSGFQILAKFSEILAIFFWIYNFRNSKIIPKCFWIHNAKIHQKEENKQK